MKNPKFYNIGKKIAEKFSLPSDVVAGTPKVTSIGKNKIAIENLKGLIKFDNKKIIINTMEGILRIIGNDLYINEVTKNSIIVSGEVENIEYS